ncbi:MAG: glycerophosphodiester phosphodiesterase [Chlorobium sp.]|jgi:glycerophosphoryl diester phosphodiesterase|uniref:glycerophosphodiester phosphodiesterase family protein n=1 Tax=Chlorobium sp. TaxID=1095 RepID=UPI0025BEA4AF|nr:glycerophosphodiester phosphodiesterase family protein [Chlorobium sp.]MCF8216670.1 glycerophosphodiester phosphodiesterase [Chlorobium sp.]MCF8270869.1 glycerophosphodiester phosphodiesterase [Chlorobium sp.]MCF8287197.1 glycerophosphodiester phosphodiesterase [Chlorobium sp.]MCF8290854.1 glycerophosphodiester phosphodiesterase [Chlorobium sp.]MCF8385629.1 glycerophosphodiester phosphodiesterase [Chlorobium sp.]
MQFEIQAHRGARAFFPENTIPAFCRAAALGVRVIELDLVVSRDEMLVVSHDPWITGPLCSGPDGMPLDRSAKERHLIYQMDYDEIARFNCGLADPAFPQQQSVHAFKPLLSDVFRDVDASMQADGRCKPIVFNLELKSWPHGDGKLHPSPDSYAAIVSALLDSLTMASRVRVQSFDRRLLAAVWRRSPGLCFGLLVDDFNHFDPFPWEAGFVPAYVNPYFPLLTPELAAELHEQGVQIIPWTVNREEDMLAMKRMGADGIITDHPELALQISELTA